MGINQLVGRRRRFRQDAEPAEWIFAFVNGEDAGRNARPTDAVKPVTATDEIAGDFARFAVLAETDAGRLAADIVHRNVLDVEQDRHAVVDESGDEILHDFLLTVNGNALAGELAEVDVVGPAVEREVDAVVEHGFALEPRTDAGLDQKVADPLFQEPGAHALLDIGTAAVLDDDGIDPTPAQQQRQHQSGRSCADDAHLGAHANPPRFSSVRLHGRPFGAT